MDVSVGRAYAELYETCVWSREGSDETDDIRSGSWQLVSKKYDGAVHRIWSRVSHWPWHGAVRDAPDHTFLIPAQTRVVESNGESWKRPYPVLACFETRSLVQSMVLLQPEGPQFYCNAYTNLQINPDLGIVSFVDMDLDVFVDREGNIELLDRGEFALHARRYSYPLELCRQVETDLKRTIKDVKQRRGVFSLLT